MHLPVLLFKHHHLLFLHTILLFSSMPKELGAKFACICRDCCLLLLLRTVTVMVLLLPGRGMGETREKIAVEATCHDGKKSCPSGFREHISERLRNNMQILLRMATVMKGQIHCRQEMRAQSGAPK